MNASVDRSLIKTIEVLSYTALPALEQRYYDGWLIRYAHGYSRRANSVNPIYASYLDVDTKISQCESIYASKKRPTIFKMTNAVHPSDLDPILDDRGYQKESETYVYTAPLIGLGASSNQVRIDQQLSTNWMTHLVRLNHIPDHHTQTLQHMIELISLPCGFGTLVIDGNVAGVALGVVAGDWMGVFDVVIDKPYRGNGYGRMIMEALLHWGEQQGASRSYLQVQADNAAATTLYQKLGYAYQYTYWYRVKR